MPFDPATLKYDAAGLIPCVAQDAGSGEVLMVAWMNAASVVATLESGRSNRRLVHQPMNPANSMVTAAPTSSAVERVAVRSRRCTGIPFRRTLFYRPVGPGS